MAVGVADEALHLLVPPVRPGHGRRRGTDRIAVAGKEQIWSLRDQSEIAPQIEPAGTLRPGAGCRAPRPSPARSSATRSRGDRATAIPTCGSSTRSSRAWPASTAATASCRAGGHRSSPGWPRRTAATSTAWRCATGARLRHRHGADGRAGGWRSVRNDSGAVLDVASGEAVTTGLAMPHSPRWHDGNLYVLNSGMGRLEHVDLATGRRDVVAVLPGLRPRSGGAPRPRLRRPVEDPRDRHLRRRADRRATTTSSSAASASSSSAPATRSPRCSSPTASRRSSTCRPSPERAARRSAVTRVTRDTWVLPTSAQSAATGG